MRPEGATDTMCRPQHSADQRNRSEGDWGAWRITLKLRSHPPELPARPARRARRLLALHKTFEVARASGLAQLA